MSAFLPPGCSDDDVERAAPGHGEEPPTCEDCWDLDCMGECACPECGTRDGHKAACSRNRYVCQYCGGKLGIDEHRHAPDCTSPKDCGF